MKVAFLLIVIFASPTNDDTRSMIGTTFKQEFPTQAGCLNVLEAAFKQPDVVKKQIINSGCYPLK